MRLRFLVIPIVAALAWFTPATGARAPQPQTVSTIATTTTTITTTTTTTTLPAHIYPECAGYLALATTLGWAAEHLPMLEVVMWRESRCQPHQLNALDPNGGSIGLTQVNRFWCLPSRYYPLGYLQTYGVLSTCEQLYEPAFNLVAALKIFDYSNGWAQWAL